MSMGLTAAARAALDRLYAARGGRPDFGDVPKKRKPVPRIAKAATAINTARREHERQKFDEHLKFALAGAEASEPVAFPDDLDHLDEEVP